MAGAWTWARIVRIALLVLIGLGLLDFALRPVEERLLAHAGDGQLRNIEGQALADACLRMLRDEPTRTRDAVVFVGASVTYGSNVLDAETLPAAVGRRLASVGVDAPVYNCAQPGGRPETAIPIAASLATGPAALLMVELMVPSYAARETVPAPAWGAEEIALLEGASDKGRLLLDEAALLPRPAARADALLAAAVRSVWRLYRIRGRLWIDDTRTPNYLVWTLRRTAAVHGLLPRQFHGQTTNVGRLPWREAYVGGNRPSGVQRFRVPEDAIHEAGYAQLLRTAELARQAGVPVLFYEVPLNLEFQRSFELMDEDELARLASIRRQLFARLRADGLDVLEAPELSDDAYLDKAHLTPVGADRLGAHVASGVATRIGKAG
jgi:hypothetical protein